MATAVTAVTTAPLPPTATATAPAADAPTDLFSAVLGATVAGADATSLADDAGLVEDVAADVFADPRATDLNAVALAAAGVLVVVPGVTPAAPQATPTVDLTDAGGATTVTSDDLPARAADAQSRSEQLRFQLAAGLQNQTPLTQQPGERTPTATQPETLPTPPAVADQARPAPVTPTAAAPANPLPNGPRAARVPTIPAQVPIVTDAVIPPAAPAPLTPPDVAVEAAPAVAGLPGAVIGDRPSMAGERFVALATTGARLAETAPAAAPAVPFADVARDAGVTPPVAAAPETITASAVPTGTTAGLTIGAREALPEPARDIDPSSFGAALPVTAPVAPQTTDAPPAVARAAPATPVAVQLTDGVTAHAHTLAATGEVEFRMRLDPPDLGQVRVNLIGSGEHVRGELVVADDAVRRMIESQLPELRQRLEAAGVTVQRFDVTTDTTGGGANANGGSADRTPAEVQPAPAAPRPARAWYAAPAPASGLDVTV